MLIEICAADTASQPVWLGFAQGSLAIGSRAICLQMQCTCSYAGEPVFCFYDSWVSLGVVDRLSENTPYVFILPRGACTPSEDPSSLASWGHNAYAPSKYAIDSYLLF
jgi:hypothetical protein